MASPEALQIYLPLALTFLFSVTHYYFEKYAHHLRRFDIAFASYSAGIFIAYIFLSMLPEVLNGSKYLSQGIFFIMLWGFVLLHIAEKHVVQHSLTEKLKTHRLAHVRTFSFFINHFIIGMAVIFFFNFDKPVLAYISLIPLFFHLISSSLIVEHLHAHVRETFLGRILSSGSLFLGALFASMLAIPLPVFYGIFAFITGTLFYIIVRDAMPKYRSSKPTYFLWGVISYLVLIGITLMAVK
ncbi:MAG TPA: hypothetical protein VJI75_04980 [Candidatus Nanoarchaeia archaeon]|nr:hypothetical protein [Candidatus Nanoarchaeia archaeon]